MSWRDFFRFTIGGITAHPLRSGLTGLGIAVGIAAVVLLTSLGEGVRQYVLAEFTQFGTHILAVTPGKVQTHGVSGAVISNVRPITFADSEALKRLPFVRGVVPFVQGNVEVEGGGRTRRVYMNGVGSDLPLVWSFPVASGRFLPDDDPRAPRAYAVLGSKVRTELFGDENPLGQPVRVGGERYRVIGVMESKGQILGFDMDDAIYVPAGRALEMLNRESLMEIDVLYSPLVSQEEIVASVKKLVIRRHGYEDFSIVTQQQMLDVLGSVLNVLTFAVGALGGISLVVAGVGILTIMTIAVTERTSEIGLLRALGAGRRQVLGLFLGEATAVAALGGLAGLAIGIGGAWILKTVVKGLPVHTPWSYVVLAEILAAAIGLAAGVFPARRAAMLDPVEALREE